MTIKEGSSVWLPCQVKPGPFSNERLALIHIPPNDEWLGFVDVDSLKDNVEEGETYVLARVTAVDDDVITTIVQGHALDSRYIQVPRTTVQRVPLSA